jgi:hypothetical protein
MRKRMSGLWLLVRTRFQALFHSPYGVLFTFPSRYCSAIGRERYCALEGGPPGFPHGFSCRVVLRVSAQPSSAVPYWTLTRSRGAFQPLRVASSGCIWRCPTTPCIAQATHGLGMLPVRSPLLRESRLMSFPRATEMVQFTRWPPVGYAFPHRSPGITPEGLPHSDPQGSSLACSSP